MMKSVLIFVMITPLLILSDVTAMAKPGTGSDDPPDWYLNPPTQENAALVVEKGTHQAEALILALVKAADVFAKKVDDLMQEFQMDSSNENSIDRISTGGTTFYKFLTSESIAGIKVEGLRQGHEEEEGGEKFQSNAIRITSPDNFYVINYSMDSKAGNSMEMAFSEGKDYSVLINSLKEAGVKTEYYYSETETYVKLIVPWGAFE